MSVAENLIPVGKFCESHQIDITFVARLRENGLVDLVSDSDVLYVHVENIPRLERIVRLHFELNINVEGIEAISHLLERLEEKQQEITLLKNRLRLYE